MAAKNLRQFEFKLGKLGVVLFIIGLAILVFTGFLLGVQVGRNIDTYPEMIARGVPGSILNSIGLFPPEMKPDVPISPAMVEHADTAAGEGSTQKAAKAAEGENAAVVVGGPPVSADADAEKKVSSAVSVKPSASPATAVETHAAPGGSSAEIKAKPVLKQTTPPAEEKPEKVPPAKSGKFSIQVVSFREKEKADGLGRKIKELGYAPVVAMTEVPGKGQWYRVTVNSFATKEVAEKAADDLTKKIKGLSCVIRSK